MVKSIRKKCVWTRKYHIYMWYFWNNLHSSGKPFHQRFGTWLQGFAPIKQLLKLTLGDKMLLILSFQDKTADYSFCLSMKPKSIQSTII